jgi:hypothetical protein
MLPDLLSDPFGERSATLTREPLQILGGRFRFDSNSPRLLRLVDSAYAGLPPQRLASKVVDFRIRLLLTRASGPLPSVERSAARRRPEPPPIAMLSGAGLLGGAADASNFVILSPGEASALVTVTPRMLRFAYHTRYELIEFAVFTLAARAQGLVPLHGACVGRDGRGILLLGESGSGKSTVALHCLLSGLDFLSEDSVFVAPNSLLATGVPNFLHIRADSLRWLGRTPEAAELRRSPVIQRRSGVRKFEVDLRRHPFQLAKSPLAIAGVVFLSARRAGNRPLLKSLSKPALLRSLTETQAYGANQPQWRPFSRKLARIEAFELRRGNHPLQAVEALLSLLQRK